MKSFIVLSVATALVHAAPLESTKLITNTFAEGELESLLPLPATAHYHANNVAAPNGGLAAGDGVDITLTSCGAFESTPDAATMYSSVNAIFVAPKITSRANFNWTRTPETLPRIAVSAGLDGIVCPTTVRAGIYATVCLKSKFYGRVCLTNRSMKTGRSSTSRSFSLAAVSMAHALPTCSPTSMCMSRSRSCRTML